MGHEPGVPIFRCISHYRGGCKGTLTNPFSCCVLMEMLILQDKRASGFQRFHHVTDPFIKRLGLEAELQVIHNMEQFLKLFFM